MGEVVLIFGTEPKPGSPSCYSPLLFELSVFHTSAARLGANRRHHGFLKKNPPNDKSTLRAGWIQKVL